jgi:hypothetical protein
MSAEQKIIPTSIFLYISRATQILVSIVVLGLDIFVIDEWNQNKFAFNAAATGSDNSDIKTWVGDTPFTGIVIFTVSQFCRTGFDMTLNFRESRRDPI